MIAARTWTDTAIRIRLLAAFSDVPENDLVFRFCLIHLKKSSTCHLERKRLKHDVTARAGPDFRLTLWPARSIHLPSGRITSEAAMAAWYGPKGTTGLSQATVAAMPPHDYVDS